MNNEKVKEMVAGQSSSEDIFIPNENQQEFYFMQQLERYRGSNTTTFTPLETLLRKTILLRELYTVLDHPWSFGNREFINAFSFYLSQGSTISKKERFRYAEVLSYWELVFLRMQSYSNIIHEHRKHYEMQETELKTLISKNRDR